ncbi:MAG: DUF2244 domain-containing protein [Pseudomonadales bacterium]
MIHCEFDDRDTSARIVLRPNHSWTWRANVYLILSLMAVSLTMAAVFTGRGFWVILPFTVLEIGVLTACLYYCVRRTHTTEVLRLDRNRLIFERGIRRPALRLELERYFTRFFVRPARHPWYRKRIELTCRDRALEVGQFLSDEEKDELVRNLRQIIHRLDTAPPLTA